MINNIHTFAIAAYKDNKYLEECIVSLINQEVKSNIIITTSTPSKYISDLAKKYKIKVFVKDKNTGVEGNFNFAIDSVKTKYITIVHQDDVYHKNFFKENLQLMKKNENIIMTFTNYYEYKNGKEIKTSKLLKFKRLMLFPLKFKLFQNCIFIRRRILSFGNAICNPSVTMNKEKIDVPLYDSNLQGNIDWYGYEKLSLKKGSFVYIDKPLVLRRLHEGSESNRLIACTNRRVEDLEMLKRFWPNPIAKIILRFYCKAEKCNKG